MTARMFGRLKNWRPVATRYDRYPTAFFSAIILAAAVIFEPCPNALKRDGALRLAGMASW